MVAMTPYSLLMKLPVARVWSPSSDFTFEKIKYQQGLDPAKRAGEGSA